MVVGTAKLYSSAQVSPPLRVRAFGGIPRVRPSGGAIDTTPKAAFAAASGEALDDV